MISYNGVEAKTSSDKAELFNAYFSSIFQPSKSDQHETSTFYLSHLRINDELREITLNEEDVAGCLGSLDLLKECSQQIAPSLCCLFNLSLKTGCIPTEWKSADVTPIHKKDSKVPVENYRPISLLPIVSKCLERCVYFRFYEHVVRFVDTSQHGFFRNRSCVSQLLSVLHTISSDLDKNTQTDVVYLSSILQRHSIP